VFGAGVAVFDTLIYGGPLRSGYRPGEITFSLSALGPNLRYMPAHLIQAMPMLVLGLGALAGIAVLWLRGRRAGGQQAAVASRDLAVALALAACWAAIWVWYATYTWTAAPGLSTLQAARFYVPALGAISLLGAWLLVRVPRRQPLAAITTLAVVAALFGLGSWAFHDMYQSPLPQLVVVPGPGGTVELEPGPGAMIGGPAAPPGRRPAGPGIRRSSSPPAQAGRREPRENAG
jgi:cytochrome bd-type quinol oxidase subunit 2